MHTCRTTSAALRFGATPSAATPHLSPAQHHVCLILGMRTSWKTSSPADSKHTSRVVRSNLRLWRATVVEEVSDSLHTECTHQRWEVPLASQGRVRFGQLTMSGKSGSHPTVPLILRQHPVANNLGHGLGQAGPLTDHTSVLLAWCWRSHPSGTAASLPHAASVRWCASCGPAPRPAHRPPHPPAAAFHAHRPRSARAAGAVPGPTGLHGRGPAAASGLRGDRRGLQLHG